MECVKFCEQYVVVLQRIFQVEEFLLYVFNVCINKFIVNSDISLPRQQDIVDTKY